VSRAWASLVAGRHRRELCRRFGLVGYVRAVEVTHGRRGWHPHLHVLLLTQAPLDLDELRDLHRFLRDRWGRRVTALGFRAPALHRGVRLLPVFSADGVGGYLTKVGDEERAAYTPGLELARQDLKAGRAWGSRAPFASWPTMPPPAPGLDARLCPPPLRAETARDTRRRARPTRRPRAHGARSRRDSRPSVVAGRASYDQLFGSSEPLAADGTR
jgi:hypothetical protein